MDALFPEYLDKESQGRAAAALQLALIFAGFATDELDLDGDYGDQTAESVKNLQRHLGIEADGNFGPATKEALSQRLGRDVSNFPEYPFMIETVAIGP